MLFVVILFGALALLALFHLVDSAKRMADAFQSISEAYSLGVMAALADTDLEAAVRKMSVQSARLGTMDVK